MSDTIDLNSPEAKAAIKAAVEEATSGLVAKRDELLAEVKQLKKGRQIDPADVEKLETDIDALKSQLTEAQKVAKRAAETAEKATKAQADAEGSVAKLLVDNGLTEALTKAGVTNPAYIEAAKAMLARDAVVVDDNGNKVAKIGDKALAEAVGEWAGSDKGKHFVTAADVSGGGSQGGRNSGGAAGKPVKDWSDGDKARFIRENGFDAWTQKLAAG